MDKKIKKTCEIAGRKLSFETGQYAPRANASVLASIGETVVLATVTASKDNTDRDYFPLTVEYIEKYYAGGVISGSRYVKRERFPSEDAILKARMIDRSLRPLFASDFMKELSLIVTVLSYDEQNDPVVIGINAASVALALSGVPFDGPIAGVKVGYKDGEYILNPGDDEIKESDMEFMLSGKGDDIVMIDAGFSDVEEDVVAGAFDFACESFPEFIKTQEELIDEVKPKKMEYAPVTLPEELKEMIEKDHKETIKKAAYKSDQDKDRDTYIHEIVSEVCDDDCEYSENQVREAIDKIMKKMVRKGILEEKKRPSKRGMDEVREIVCENGILPRTHGSAFFARGVTQAMSIATLGSLKLEQTVETFEGEDTKRYMHHYNGPGYSIGEPRYRYYPGRREIGHGALAEKALRPMIPDAEEFPYAIRVVSEILAQQGSSSMASTCGSTLALIDAGVPLKKLVAGIAVGLVTGETQEDYQLIVDVQDVEDFFGDMDFKVTGTKDGITAIQMDNKLKGVNKDILKEALGKAKEARLSILGIMENSLPEDKGLSKYAPKIETITIDKEKIGELIGPGGKVVKNITEVTGADLDINDDGTVHILAAEQESLDKALDMVNAITEEAEIGKVYEGTVDKIMPYGAFVDVTPAISGLVHISELADGFVKDPSDVVKEGEKVKVKVVGIDDEGRINLSMKRASEKGDGKKEEKKEDNSEKEDK